MKIFALCFLSFLCFVGAGACFLVAWNRIKAHMEDRDDG